MKPSMKKLLSMLVALACLVDGLCTGAYAAGTGNLVEVDNAFVQVLSDSKTDTAPSDFATPYTDGSKGGPADGRVWTDKSVTAETDSSGNLTGNFEVTLSAMAQEYITSAEEISNFDTTHAADVLFILDFSTSMTDAGEDAYNYDHLKTAISDSAKTKLVWDDTLDTPKYITLKSVQ